MFPLPSITWTLTISPESGRLKVTVLELCWPPPSGPVLMMIFTLVPGATSSLGSTDWNQTCPAGISLLEWSTLPTARPRPVMAFSACSWVIPRRSIIVTVSSSLPRLMVR